MLLYPDHGRGVLSALRWAARDGTLTMSRVVDSYQRIVALKRRLPGS